MASDSGCTGTGEGVEDGEAWPGGAFQKEGKERNWLLGRVAGAAVGGCGREGQNLVGGFVVVPRAAEVVVFAAEVVVFAAERAASGVGAEGLVVFPGGEGILGVSPIMAGSDGGCTGGGVCPFVELFLSGEAEHLLDFFAFLSHVFFYGSEAIRV